MFAETRWPALLSLFDSILRVTARMAVLVSVWESRINCDGSSEKVQTFVTEEGPWVREGGQARHLPRWIFQQ